MRLRSVTSEAGPVAAVVTSTGPVAISSLRASGLEGPSTVEGWITERRLPALAAWLHAHPSAVTAAPRLVDPAPAALLARPPKILGVGLNYADHASDLGETRPDEPATFMKPSTTILAPGAPIPIPRQSHRTTGEAEIALIVGEPCKDVQAADAPSVIAGVTTVIDMTAEDILQRNPRFLTRSKSFDGFLVIGPDLVTLDEIGDIDDVEVVTTLDGRPERRNVVANMMTRPWQLVEFFSAVMPLEPGDVISTGTPGAVVLRDGCTVGCIVSGVGSIENPVIDLKVRG